MFVGGTQREGGSFGYELAAIAAGTSFGRDPSPDLLRILSSLGVADAAMLTRRQNNGAVEVAATFGYPSELIHFIVDPHFVGSDPAYRSILGDSAHVPYRHWGSMAVDYAESEVAQRFLLPAGFRNGVSARLETYDGHYVGDFFMSTTDAGTPSAKLLDVLHQAGSLVAEIQEVAGLNDNRLRSDAVVLVRHDGTVRTVTDSSDSAVMSSFIEHLVAITSERVRSGGFGGDRWVGRIADASGTWHVVSAEMNRNGLLLCVSEQMPPFSLTARDLEVLGGCCDGLTNGSIARRMGISERTVSHRIERIYSKMGVTSRASAVAMCAEHHLRLI
jgi:DNA-binding NarL/FixJ family response regulator